METNFYRPWGKLEWILNKTHGRIYDLIGCLSTEQRCTETFRILKNFNKRIKLNSMRKTDFKLKAISECF